MLKLSASPALSAFRREKLLTKLQALQPQVSSVYAEFVHFVELNDR
jgi:phosphoribosylformylglycinamidine synthase